MGSRGMAPGAVRVMVLLVAVAALGACGKKQETQPAPERAPATAAPSAKSVEKDRPLGTPPPILPASPPQRVRLRPGAKTLLAQYVGGVLIPTATLQGARWVPEELQTLDKLPEGYRGKDARADVVRAWWSKLGLKDGDTLILRGSRGAQGTFKVREAFATADRGGCVGLVWAIPGEATWTVEPRGQTQWATPESKREYIWAFRGPWIPPVTTLDRPLTPEEEASARATLRQVRATIRKALPPPDKGGAWEECDSLNEPPCPSARAGFNPIDIDSDGRLEAIATIQFREPRKYAGRDATPMESRILIGFTKDNGYLLGKWDGDSSKYGEAARAPTFTGAIDLTGDGRAELIFRQVIAETENFLVYQASAEKSGRWHLLFRTTTEGC